MSGLGPRVLAGEHEAFHGHPTTGVELLWNVLADHPELPRARWLLGVCLGALGRYTAAAAVLGPAVAGDSLAASARASHLRQLERHAAAETLDRAALRLARDGPPHARTEALADALTGLVADAVGRHDLPGARERLAEAAEHVARSAGDRSAGDGSAGDGSAGDRSAGDRSAGDGSAGDGSAGDRSAGDRSAGDGSAGDGSAGDRAAAAAGWRAPIRLAWVSAEVALLGTRPDEAARQAEDAVRRSIAAGAPRHLAKSLLFRGVAEQVLGAPSAASTLDAAARAAQDLGLLPLLWPARLVRSRILAESEPETARGDLAAAHAAMRAIAVGLTGGDS
jgi:hypothetical protein